MLPQPRSLPVKGSRFRELGYFEFPNSSTPVLCDMRL